MKHPARKQGSRLAAVAVIFIFTDGIAGVSKDPDLTYPDSNYTAKDMQISRDDYYHKLQGFWLGQCIANWTGLRTEMARRKPPFYTDADWGTKNGRKSRETNELQMIEFVLVGEGEAWGADDDTDIEYIYQDALDVNNTSMLSPRQIRDAWLGHIRAEEQNYLWVSNQRALELMLAGHFPPATSLPENNDDFHMIDAQLTTEIFGLLAPARPDVALKMAHLPIRTTAYLESEWISEFYVVMHALASRVDRSLSMKDQVLWISEQARKRLPGNSYPAKMYDFIKSEYDNNPDKDNWELTRDRFSDRYSTGADGYKYVRPAEAGINFGASLISLFYGEGDYQRTVRIGALCGWDSDNPTATWGGLLGFMLGREGVEKLFPEVKLSDLYHIGRTRINFADRTPDLPGDDRFDKMAQRGIHIIDRVIIEELGGSVDLEKGIWHIPQSNQPVTAAKTNSDSGNLQLSRSRYHEQLQGFWLAECIANWTGLVTEMDKIGDTGEYRTMPFYTRDDWGKPDLPSIWASEPSNLSPTIDFVLREAGEVWGSDDDTDIEYIYQELLLNNQTSILSGEQIRDGWLRHIKSEEENFLWVSNERAYRLMEEGVIPPKTSDPSINEEFEMIDAQLTTEIFGLFAPARPDVALKMAYLPIRTTARENAALISEFYVTMHSLAALYDGDKKIGQHLAWAANQARKQLPQGSYSASMYDFVKSQYESGVPWEAARDAVHQKYQVRHEDGYDQSHKMGNGCFAAGINFAASLVSLFYGEGDLKETIKIGVLCGWDADNPTATWGGLIGFLMGRELVEKAFPEIRLSGLYNISRTRINFPDRTPTWPGDDTFKLMADRGLQVIDRVVVEELGGTVDKQRGVWSIPARGKL